MSNVFVTFPDPVMETLAILRALGTVSDFGTMAPNEFPAEAMPTFPWSTVTVDSSAADYPVNETTNLRIRVWAVSADEGYALAQTLRGRLLAFAGSERVRSFSALTSPIPTVDPDDKSFLCAFTVAARLKPIME